MMKLGEIARLLKGELVGDPELEVEGVSSPLKPRRGTLVFCRDKREEESARAGEPAALVLSTESDFPNYIRVEDVRYALAVFLDRFYPERHPSGVSDRAHIGRNVSMGENVYVGEFAYVGDNVQLGRDVKIYPFTYVGANTVVGDGTVIFSGVHIYPNTVIGERVRIHSGVVIGADGFGYHVGREGIKKLNHIGNVVIEDDVEIGANTTVDRALIDSTRIGRLTKVDNLVMIAHNCVIGEGNIIVGQSGFAGSSTTGRNVVIAGQVAVGDHVHIGDNVTVVARAAVSKSLKEGGVYGGGIPAMEWRKWKRIYALLMKLPELLRKG